MAGFRVVPVACDSEGNIDVANLEAKAAEHAERLAALMQLERRRHFLQRDGEVVERGGLVLLARLVKGGLTRPVHLPVNWFTVVGQPFHSTSAGNSRIK